MTHPKCTDRDSHPTHTVKWTETVDGKKVEKSARCEGYIIPTPKRGK